MFTSAIIMACKRNLRSLNVCQVTGKSIDYIHINVPIEFIINFVPFPISNVQQ